MRISVIFLFVILMTQSKLTAQIKFEVKKMQVSLIKDEKGNPGFVVRGQTDFPDNTTLTIRAYYRTPYKDSEIGQATVAIVKDGEFYAELHDVLWGRQELIPGLYVIQVCFEPLPNQNVTDKNGRELPDIMGKYFKETSFVYLYGHGTRKQITSMREKYKEKITNDALRFRAIIKEAKEFFNKNLQNYNEKEWHKKVGQWSQEVNKIFNNNIGVREYTFFGLEHITEADFEHLSQSINMWLGICGAVLKGRKDLEKKAEEDFRALDALCEGILKKLGAVALSAEEIRQMLVSFFNHKEQIIAVYKSLKLPYYRERFEQVRRTWQTDKDNLKGNYIQHIFKLRRALLDQGYRQLQQLLELGEKLFAHMDNFVREQTEKESEQIQQINQEINQIINQLCDLLKVEKIIKEDK